LFDLDPQQKAGGTTGTPESQKDSKAEVKAMIERRKKIDDDLEKLNKETTVMVKRGRV
jgi:hypothetical protein